MVSVFLFLVDWNYSQKCNKLRSVRSSSNGVLNMGGGGDLMIDWTSLSSSGVGERLGSLDMVKIPGTDSSRFFRFGGTRIG